MTRTFLAMCLCLVVLASAAEQAAVIKPAIPKTESQCVAAGGELGQWGLPMPNQRSSRIPKASDGGKACTDSKHCQGDCLAPAGAVDGASVTGQCSPNVLNFGTYRIVRGGKVGTMYVE